MTLCLLMPLTKTLPGAVRDQSMCNVTMPGLSTKKCKVSFWKERREIYLSITLSTTLVIIFHCLNIHAKYCMQHTSLRFECWNKWFPENQVKQFLATPQLLGISLITFFSCKCLRSKEFLKEATFLSNLFWDVYIFLTINLFSAIPQGHWPSPPQKNRTEKWKRTFAVKVISNWFCLFVCLFLRLEQLLFGK